MPGERQRERRRLWPLKAVMEMPKNNEKYTPQEIADLFEITRREGEAIRQLTGCVAELEQVEAAKECLKSLTPAEVRAALEYRRLTVSEQTP